MGEKLKNYDKSWIFGVGVTDYKINILYLAQISILLNQTPQ
jgi:hypothetical protein